MTKRSVCCDLVLTISGTKCDASKMYASSVHTLMLWIESCEVACKFDHNSKFIPIVNNLTLKFPSFMWPKVRKSSTFCQDSLNHRVWQYHRSSANSRLRLTYYEWMKTVALLINQFKCQWFKNSLASFKIPYNMVPMASDDINMLKRQWSYNWSIFSRSATNYKFLSVSQRKGCWAQQITVRNN